MPEITRYIEILLGGGDLDMDQARALLDGVFDGTVPDLQLAAFLTAMRAKGPCSAELAGLALSLRAHAVVVDAAVAGMVDTCGTGGASVKTMNISTAAALVAAGAGAYVAKHGNRGITSPCGSADCLAELGVNIEAGPEVVARCIRQAHIGFMLAPLFHPAMKRVQSVRRVLGFRTVFNVLGPLANPAGVRRQVVGVADQSLAEPVALALAALDTERAMVVHCAGLDEIGLHLPTHIVHVRTGRIEMEILDPACLGIRAVTPEKIGPAADARHAAEAVRGVLDGADNGPRRDIVVLNAAAAIIVAGLAGEFGPAVELAAGSIDSGAAAGCLAMLVKCSRGE